MCWSDQSKEKDYSNGVAERILRMVNEFAPRPDRWTLCKYAISCYCNLKISPSFSCSWKNCFTIGCFSGTYMFENACVWHHANNELDSSWANIDCSLSVQFSDLKYISNVFAHHKLHVYNLDFNCNWNIWLAQFSLKTYEWCHQLLYLFQEDSEFENVNVNPSQQNKRSLSNRYPQQIRKSSEWYK